ncbi:MAG: helix-turn-helix domain-containing protein, partial [Oscillospiraceae bacterium]|nr:helix-turn-helix domain-containing protein [Oscillospiraceae bacterium]
PRETLFVIGPYLTVAPDEEQFLEWAELMGVSPARLSTLKQEFSAIPIIQDSSQLYVLLDVFYEHLWGPNGFTVEYLEQDSLRLPVSVDVKENTDQEATLREMRQMELRYSYENELMAAVAKGHLHKADVLLGSISTFLFEQRVADPIRNAKNYCIIMNTLLRKAAQQGGVHPIHLDRVSSGFAARIEQLTSLDGIAPFMMEMFRTYCRLVRKRTMKDYSPIVQQAILSIEANLSGALSLSHVSKVLNISGSYLSTIFKKETGQTLTDYISACRVDKAMELLRTTKLQIQTIAQHCGIVDVHYFSRIFKKVTGQTPKEYRQALRR